MLALRIAFKITLIIFFFILPTSGLAGLLYGIPGIKLGIFLPVLLMLVIAFLSEKLCIRHYSRFHLEKTTPPPELLNSFRLALTGHFKNLPRLRIYSDPTPHILAVQSLGGRGTVLMSEGLISILGEEELRLVMLRCALRLRESDATLRSFCSTVALILFQVTPTQWTRLYFSIKTPRKKNQNRLSPASTLGFLIFYPYIHFLFDSGQPIVPSKKPITMPGSYRVAIQKISRVIQIWGPGSYSGGFYLYLIHPVSGFVVCP